MSWLNFAASAIGGLFGLGANAYQASQANKWNQKQLDAQIAENQKNRDFNHSEAEIARNFQADFAREMFDKTNKYNSISNQVAQMRQAGINPALAYSGNSFAPGSMPSVSAGGASSSGNVSPTQYATTDVASPALAIARQQAEIANIEASTKKIESDTTGQNYQNDILKSDAAFRDAWNQGQLDLNGVNINLGESQAKVNDEQAAKLRADTALVQKQVDSFDTTLKLLNTQIESGQLDNIGKRIDNYFKTPQYEALIDKIHSETGKNKAEIHRIFATLPHEIAVLQSQAYKNTQEGALAGQKTFTEQFSRAVLKKTASLYDLQIESQTLENKLTSIDLANAKIVGDARKFMTETPVLKYIGYTLYGAKDLLQGIVSAPVAFGKKGGGITINN